MQKQPPVAAVHHGRTETNEARRPITQFMGDPVPFGNGVCAEQRRGNFTVSGAVKATIKSPKRKHEPVYARLRQRRWVRAGIAAVQHPPQPEDSHHSDFKKAIKRQKNCRRICTVTVQMHAHPDAETLDDVVITFSSQDGIK